MVKSYKVSEKDMLLVRNNIITDVGIPALKDNGYCKFPFSGSWFGKNNLGDFTYELCRVSKSSQLEIIVVHISSGDKYIKVYLNIFELIPTLNSCSQLINKSGTKFGLPPNNITEMRLRSDDYKGPPIFYMLFLPEHKVGRYNSKNKFEREIKKLRNIIKTDMTNIDKFVNRWHELYKMNITDWEGNLITKATH